MSTGLDRRSWIRRLRRVVLAGLALGAAGMTLFFLLLVPRIPEIPSVDSLVEREASTVISRSGDVLGHLGRRPGGWTPLTEIDSTVIDALLATEDRRFYHHPGVDWRRSLAAAFHTLTGDRQGGSTITQQLARNLFPEKVGTASTVARKALEVMTAVRLEQVYSKDHILEIYLNTVPFLYGAFGIERAAQTYFGISSDELSAAQAATLVGMLRGPAYYNPVRHPERARARRNLVLRLMMETGRLERARYEEARSRPLDVRFESQLMRDSPAPHFLEYVRKRVTAWCRTEGCDPYADGLVIRTGLDLRFQALAREAVRRQSRLLQRVVDRAWARPERRAVPISAVRGAGGDRPEDAFAYFWRERPNLLDSLLADTDRYRRLRARGAGHERALLRLRSDVSFAEQLQRRTTRLEAGFVALDPATGRVRAWVGSRDFGVEQFDHVVQARRQPGSTFKPFVYAAALRAGYTPQSRLRDERITIHTESGTPWRPANAGPVTGREMALREGLIRSKNTITARLVASTGAEPVAELARRLGIRSSPLRAVPSLALGTSEVTLLEMATAYGSFARQGAYRETVAIRRIESADGRTLARFGGPTEQVIDTTTARSVLAMMRGVIERGTGRELRTRFGIDAEVAGKTGTTQAGTDGWFFLVHPDLVAGSWMGFNDPRVRFRTGYWGQGARNGLRVVGDFAVSAFEEGLLDEDATLPVPEEKSPFLDLRPIADRVGGWLNRAAERIGLRDPDEEKKRAKETEEPKPTPEQLRGW